MKKLEDIPKKEIFTAPEGYFDKLPGVIQARINAPMSARNEVSMVWIRFAIPAMVIVIAAFIFWMNQKTLTPEVDQLLATIQTADLITYLEDYEFTTDELLESVEFNELDIEEVEEMVYVIDTLDIDLTDFLESNYEL